MWRWQHPRLLGPTLLALLAIGLATPQLDAQTPKWFSFSFESDKNKGQEILSLRPNTVHGVEFYLTHLDPDKSDRSLTNATVRLINVANGRELAKAVVDKLAPGKDVKLKFIGKAEENPKKGDESPKMELTGPKSHLQLWLEVGGEVIAKENVYVKIKPPDSYIKATGKFNKADGSVSVDVEIKEDVVLPGPSECNVELVFDPQFTPGIKLKTFGLAQTLTTPGQKVKLYANLQFEGGNELSEDARIFLTVDGYKRAFEFKVPAGEKGTLGNATYTTDVAVRFRVPRFDAPAEKWLLPLQIDGEIDKAMRVEVSRDPTGTRAENEFQVQKKNVKSGLRDIQVGIAVDKEKGDLSFFTKVEDWKLDLDTRAINGPCTLRVRVLAGAEGKELMPLSADALLPLAKLADDASKFAVLDLAKEKGSVYADVVFDNSKPDGLQFVDLPKEWTAGQMLTLKATANERDKGLAPISKAFFFYGPVAADGKLPADAKEGDWDEKAGHWWADLPTEGKLGKQEVAVQFVTFTGGKADANAFVNLKKAAAVAADAKKKSATIKGTVFHGSDAKAKVDVFLMDAKLYQKNAEGALKGQTKSDEKGEFKFEDVPPGNYVIVANQTTPLPVIGRVPVTVNEEGKLFDSKKLDDEKKAPLETVKVPVLSK